MSDSSINQQTGSENVWADEVAKQLLKIASLEPNWNRMDAEAPSQKAISDARNFLKMLNRSGLEVPKPGISPTASGGIQFDWESGSKAFELEFEPNGTLSFLFEDEENLISREESLHPGEDIRQLFTYFNNMYV